MYGIAKLVQLRLEGVVRCTANKQQRLHARKNVSFWRDTCCFIVGYADVLAKWREYGSDIGGGLCQAGGVIFDSCSKYIYHVAVVNVHIE